MKFAVAVRQDRVAALAAARDAATRMTNAGHTVLEASLDSATLSSDLGGAEMAWIFGGDGTMLRAARLLGPIGIPLLGVNLGRLGFLTAGSMDEFDATLEEVAAGDYRLDERRLLEVRVLREGREILRASALNDAVVARGLAVRSIHIGVQIDGEPFTVYWADGLIVATATGSTAYGFAVGGPIILPGSEAVMIVPIAPHLSFRNAVVLDHDQAIALEIHDEPARLSLDGQDESDLRSGDVVEVTRSATMAKFVRTPSMPPFLSLLKRKILKEGGGI